MRASDSVRLADPNAEDVAEAAGLLHDFNVEFGSPSPRPAVLAARLRRLLSGDAMFALLAGRPAVGLAIVSLRGNVWHEGPVALLDELYVAPDHRNRGIGGALIAGVRAESLRRGVELIEINVDEPDVDARRFYERHGFSPIEPDTGAFALYYQGPAAG
jgi:GNAT superfamily N-acetyltransferase